MGEYDVEVLGLGKTYPGGVEAVKPLAFLPARKSAAQPAKARPVRTPVQAELSLERVKVVRNDLSDADLEVVSAKTPSSVPAKTEPIAAHPAMPEDTQQCNVETSRVASRLADAGKT